MAEPLPSVLTDPALMQEEPAESSAPQVSPFLIEYLRKAFPVKLPDTSHGVSPAEVFGEVSRRQGQQEVLDHLAQLLNAQAGDTPNVVSSSETQDQSARSGTPRAARWR